MDILTGAQMRSFEQAAMASGQTTGLDLMERAGRGVVEAVFSCWHGLEDGARSALVLCGPGNNGGDGFVIARLLHRRGWRVEVCLLGNRARLPADAATNAQRWEEIGETHPLTDEVLENRSEKPDLIVDALFGSGLSRAFTGFPKMRRAINRLRETDAPERRSKIVAVDVPSGLCCDSGRFPGYEGEDGCMMPILADLTVTFHRPKAGHYLADGPHACGRLAIADIGL